MVPHVFNPRTQEVEVETSLVLNKSKVSNIKFLSTIKFSEVNKLCQKSESQSTFSSVVIITWQLRFIIQNERLTNFSKEVTMFLPTIIN